MEVGVITLVSILFIGAFGAACIFILRRKSKIKQTDTCGMLNVVYDESCENPQLVLALYDPVEVVANQKQVLFDVNIIHQDSRK